MKQASVRIGLGIILCVLLSGNLVEAGSIQFSFTGIVTGSNGGMFPPFAIGQQMFGSFAVTGPLNASTDSNPSLNVARYNDRITNLSVTIGASTPYVATFGPTDNHITIRNLPALDSAHLVANTLISGDAVNGFTPTRFKIDLVDGTAAAFDSQYPTTVPGLGSFLTTNRWRLEFGSGHRVQGALTALTAVPLPAAVILFGVGIVALAGLGAGSWRQRKNSLIA